MYIYIYISDNFCKTQEMKSQEMKSYQTCMYHLKLAISCKHSF